MPAACVLECNLSIKNASDEELCVIDVVEAEMTLEVFSEERTKESGQEFDAEKAADLDYLIRRFRAWLLETRQVELTYGQCYSVLMAVWKGFADHKKKFNDDSGSGINSSSIPSS